MTSIFGEKVQRRNPDAAMMAPAIVTALHPNLLVRTLASGPGIVRMCIKVGKMSEHFEQ